MIHHRQRLALGLEPSDNLLGVHAQLDDLQRHAAPDRLLLFGYIDDAAAAFANHLTQLVMANFVAWPFKGDVRIHSGFVEKRARLLVRGQERLHLRPERGVASAFPIQQCGAFGGVRQFQRRGEQFFRGLGHVTLDISGDALDYSGTGD